MGPDDWVNHIVYLSDDTNVCHRPERLGSSFVKNPIDGDFPTCPRCSSLLQESLRNDNTQNLIENKPTTNLYILVHVAVISYISVMALLVLNILG